MNNVTNKSVQVDLQIGLHTYPQNQFRLEHWSECWHKMQKIQSYKLRKQPTLAKHIGYAAI